MFRALKKLIIGRAKDPNEANVFHRLSLIAFFAWVGLGADGLSSSCYGPEEAFLALGEHKYLGIFVAILTAVTVFLISASYSQIIELFPGGGGGYLVASKLLNPTLGMISGCALLIDYVLTIAISIASGADALFSFLPSMFLEHKLLFVVLGVVGLMVLNLRGVKESVVPLTPIFMIFIITHLFAIVYAFITHAGNFPQIVNAGTSDVGQLHSQVGTMGIIFLILRAYSLGAGTFTGIEAVSNGTPMLRDPKVQTAKMTMRYMAFSLAFTVVGLMVGYLLFDVSKAPGKTLNAILFEGLIAGWPAPWGHVFLLVTLVSEAMLLFVAAQAGFLDGPRVLASMAMDRWMPTSFSSLSDRLVSQNGILLMGVAAAITMVFTKGSVGLLVILYSINVFITFCLSQAGMVRHWWEVRAEEKRWKKKIFLNGLGLTMTGFILCSVVILKFHEGGWVTLLITGALVMLAIGIKGHYKDTMAMLNRLSPLVETTIATTSKAQIPAIKADPKSKTAVILVNGFNGLGLHTMMSVSRYFGREFKNYIFIQVGVIDAGSFKGADGLARLKASVSADLEKYVNFMQHNGYFAQSFYALGTDIMAEIEQLAQEVVKQYPDCVFFGGQLVFPRETFMTQLLHNHTVFTIQKRLYHQGIPFMVLPVRI